MVRGVFGRLLDGVRKLQESVWRSQRDLEWLRERSWAGFKRFLAGCRTLGSLQEVPASVGRVVESFGEVFDRFWEVSGR